MAADAPDPRRTGDSPDPRRPTPARASPTPLDPTLVQQFIELQQQEVSVRRDELAVRKMQLANSHETAQRSVELQAADRADDRKDRRHARRERLIFAAFIVAVLAGFIVYALAHNKDAFAMEALKAATYLLTGGLGGYALRATKKEKSSPDE